MNKLFLNDEALASMRIVLDRIESSVFRILTDCVRQEGLQVTLRVAGGWVRDKLLGFSSHDIDIAIDTMMGRPFVDRLRAYLLAHPGKLAAAEEEEGAAAELRGVGTIKSNPAKSKHLETATMMLCGVSVDFVNLRSESYAADGAVEVGAPLSNGSVSPSASSSSSRIPVRVDFGSPEEDALRRDITINALFYNLHSEQVEDFCGRGLSDLQNGLVRTPLNPLVTLLDDPLRLLRVIRFAARFEYRIVVELMEALHNEHVHRAFRNKVSRERVGIEIDKMLTHRNVHVGMYYLLHERIYPLIFLDSRVRIDSELILQLYKEHLASYPDARLAAYTALFLPLASKTYEKESPVLRAVRDGLKRPGRDYQLIARLVDGIFHIVDCRTADPVSVGRAIMALGEQWRLSCRLANAYCEYQGIDFDSSLFIAAADSFGLTDCFQMRPLLNGSDVKRLFGISDGRVVGEMLKQALDIQLKNPKGTKDELVNTLRNSFISQ